jgi:glycosyltransferase involved in cell wall biosynthesis
MQGMLSQIQKYVYSGLSISDIVNCFGLKEILRPSGSLIGLKYRLGGLAKFESEIIKRHTYISTQSNWTKAHIHYCNPGAQIFSTRIPLRKEFLGGIRWDYSKCKKNTVFTSAASASSFKGLHILIEAIGLLKTSFPEIKLRIAGYIGKGIRQSGYTKFLKTRIKKLGIEKNVYWLGPLTAQEMVDNLLKAHVAVIPSFIESYCVALEEPLTIGVPCVASYAGAMPELAVHNESALYFPPGDSGICASYIEQIFVNHGLAQKLSDNSYSRKKVNTEIDISRVQVEIYNSVLGSNKI